MNKSLSESNLNASASNDSITPPNFVFGRAKKRKEIDSPLIDTQCGSGDSEISALREEMRAMFVSLHAAQRKEFDNINPTLKQIQETNNRIECSIDFLSRQNLELQQKIETLERKEDARHITALEDKIEDILKNTRKANFEIKNVPKKDNESKEDLVKIVTCLSSIVGETASTILKTDLLQNVKHIT